LHHKLIPVVIGVFAAMLLAGTIALAAPSPGGVPSASNAGTGVTTTVTTTVTITGQQKIALAIAKEFSVTVASVMAVRDQGMGWGEVFKVFRLAKLTGKDVSEIITLRQDEGWGQVFRSLGLKPGLGTNNLGQAIKADKGDLSSTTPVSGTTSIVTDKKPQTQMQSNTGPTNAGNPGNGNRGNNPKSNNGKGNGDDKNNGNGKNKGR